MTSAVASFLSDVARAELEQWIVARVEDEVARRLSEQPHQTSGSPYMTVREAAEFLRCRRQRVDDLLSQRRLRRFKDGTRTLILREELEAYVEEQP